MPSQRTAGMPYPAARSATPGTGIWSRIGTEIAYWLFSQMKTIGRRWIDAKLSPSWKSPLLVAPSPNQQNVTAHSWRILLARAAPTAWGMWVAIEVDGVGMRSRGEV